MLIGNGYADDHDICRTLCSEGLTKFLLMCLNLKRNSKCKQYKTVLWFTTLCLNDLLLGLDLNIYVKIHLPFSHSNTYFVKKVLILC